MAGLAAVAVAVGVKDCGIFVFLKTFSSERKLRLSAEGVRERVGKGVLSSLAVIVVINGGGCFCCSLCFSLVVVLSTTLGSAMEVSMDRSKIVDVSNLVCCFERKEVLAASISVVVAEESIPLMVLVVDEERSIISVDKEKEQVLPVSLA